MPFRKNEQGTFWVDPTPEDVLKFTENLVNPDVVKEDLTARLNSFVAETLNGAKRLADSNIATLSALKSISTRGGMGLVDIVMPVYGGYYIVKESIKALQERTFWPYRITVVDDASPDNKTKNYLKELQASWADLAPPFNHQVIFQKKNKGFSATVNAGIRATNGRYICVFNSDVLVTDNWLTKLVLALESDPRNKIVNPCTNNTALIDVPMQPGISYINMNRALERCSSHRYPEIMPTGFCFMFHRSLTNLVGLLDEGFENYGEETDYWMRVISHVHEGEYPRWRAVLADDTYVFHERGSSFSSLGSNAHMNKRTEGSQRFHARWPSYKNWAKSFDVKRTMAPIRTTLPIAAASNPKWKYNIAFVTFSTAYCGGMKYISDIVNYLIENNVNAKVVQIKRSPKHTELGTLGELRTAPVVFESPEDIIKNFRTRVFDKGVVVAATNEVATVVKHICRNDSKLPSVLFAQSHDPLLSNTEEIKKDMTEAYSSVNHIIANAKWLDDDIKNNYNVPTLGYVHPGYDDDIYFLREREDGDDRPTVLISLLRTYAFKGYERGIELAVALSKLFRQNSESFRIMAIGTTVAHECPDIICLGDTSPNYLSKLMSTEVDIFVDPSHIHTYGLMSLEAMASGVVPVLWDNKGIHEYAKHNINAMIFKPDEKPEVLAEEIYKLLKDKERLTRLKAEAVNVNQVRSSGVIEFVDKLEKNFNLNFKSRRIAVITPHLRKRGGPTTIMDIAHKLQDKGHEVDLYSIHSDFNVDILKDLRVPIHVNWKKIKKCDLLITNSDGPENVYFNRLPQVSKKVLLKLSHNKRFQKLEDDSLKLKWDTIMTSTQWLADTCMKPQVEEGWTHPPHPAKRLGWYHYDHVAFAKSPVNRIFNNVNVVGSPAIIVGTLAHHYPLKGTQDAMKALLALKQKWGDKLYVVTVGEQAEWKSQKPDWCDFFFNLNRHQMAEFMGKIDIWLSSSHTEGLGRMGLEAMSASAACILSNTGAEYAVDGKNCLLTEIGNIRHIAIAVDKLISDVEARKSISINGFETAVRWSNEEAYAKELNKIVQEIFND